MEGEMMYPLIDKMLMEEEFKDVNDRVVISAYPKYLSSLTSSPAVLNYNKNFIKAVSR